MDLNTFLNLSTPEVAGLVQTKGPKVGALPINGTRRWFLLEHPLGEDNDFESVYLEAMIARYIRVYGLLFAHGLQTVLAPAFGPDLMERGEEYTQMAMVGWVQMINHPDFIDFCNQYQVSVRFYGDYRKVLAPTPHAHVLALFDDLTAWTAAHTQCRLFFGLFAHDATETVAELAVRYHAEHGEVPNKRTLVELYYGDYVDPVDFFIGFDRFSAFDMPLVTTGSEDLYFTVCPTPYLNAQQLRTILYDHLYTRRDEPDYAEVMPEDWALMRDFYQANQGKTQGIGIKRGGGFWYPLPQVNMPDGFIP